MSRSARRDAARRRCAWGGELCVWRNLILAATSRGSPPCGAASLAHPWACGSGRVRVSPCWVLFPPSLAEHAGSLIERRETAKEKNLACGQRLAAARAIAVQHRAGSGRRGRRQTRAQSVSERAFICEFTASGVCRVGCAPRRVAHCTLHTAHCVSLV